MPIRTDYCGALRSDDIGRKVTVCGWMHRRREHGEHLAFVDLRDHTGLVQCVVDGSVDVRSEYILRIDGIVAERPDGTVNDSLATGRIEITDCTVEILSASEPPPFPIDRAGEVDETFRIKHRYVDLRTDRLQKNLRLRARINRALRAAMDEQNFVEIETPNLVASTPEGARDFVVPSRLHPGTFYALPQSPQILKQLCMAGGIDRYYQIARCFRDEDLRADRQFEFSQLDVEMSFATQDDVLDAVSHAVRAAVTEAGHPDPGDIPHMTWIEAMERFGSDKPDLRFGIELTELTDLFSETDFKAFGAESIKGIRHAGAAEEMGRGRLDALTDKVKAWGAKGLVWMKVGDDGELTSPVAKFMSESELAGVKERLGGEPGDVLYLVADDKRTVWRILGLLRLELGRPPVTEGGFNFVWITEFPLFEPDDNGNATPAHHPFTQPHPDDADEMRPGGDLLSIRSQAYDLVLNGWELGSGSVRIHNADLQARVFATLGIDDDEVERRFGFLLSAFKFGAPPHAGFAVGIDRLVAILGGEENIREVIAFPKTQSGADPMTTAPTEIDAAQLNELGLRLLPKT